MRSRKVGVNNLKKHNATKRKRASKIKKSKKKKLYKRKRRTRKRTRRQRGGNADFVVVVIGTHGSHCTLSEGKIVQQSVLPDMDIRKINASPLGMINKTRYNSDKHETEFIAGSVQKLLNNCKENCELSSAALELASTLKKNDEYTQDRHFLEDDIKFSKDWLRNLKKYPDFYKREFYSEKDAYNEKVNKLKSEMQESKIFMNKTDQRYQIEIINGEHPTYYNKSYSTVGDYDITLFEQNKEPIDITDEILSYNKGNNKSWYLSGIEIYLYKNRKYNVIIVDLSCSGLDNKDGFTDRHIRYLNYDLKQEGSLLPNPYKEDWQNKKKRKLDVSTPTPEESESESYMVPEF